MPRASDPPPFVPPRASEPPTPYFAAGPTSATHHAFLAEQPHTPPPPHPYPLTFPAFPETAQTAQVEEPSTPGVWEATGWRPSEQQPEQDYAVQFARGSQPEEELGPVARMVMTPPPVRAAKLPPATKRPPALTMRDGSRRNNQ
jgi:hypothetical protein